MMTQSYVYVYKKANATDKAPSSDAASASAGACVAAPPVDGYVTFEVVLSLLSHGLWSGADCAWGKAWMGFVPLVQELVGDVFCISMLSERSM